MKSLSPDEVRALSDAGGVDVIDVREAHEWIGGHLPGARLVPLGTFLRDPRANVRGERVIFVCAHGLRSVTAGRRRGDGRRRGGLQPRRRHHVVGRARAAAVYE